MDISEILNHDSQFRYMLLSRMQSDCEYYLGNGNYHSKHLWATDEAKHIEYMVEIWNSFPEQDKPEWLTFEQINDYAIEMGVDFSKVISQIESKNATKALNEFTNMTLKSENSIESDIVVNLCNFYNTETVVNLLNENQKDMLCNLVEIVRDYGDPVDKALSDICDYILHSRESTVQRISKNEKINLQNETLPKGWEWEQYEDGSGHLKSPEGKTYFSYDWTTGEYKITDDKPYESFLKENINSRGYSIGSFSDFKKMAESYIKENVLQKEKSSVRDKLEKIKTNDNKNQMNNANEKSHNNIVADFIAE